MYGNPHVSWQDWGGLEAEVTLKPLIPKNKTLDSKGHMPLRTRTSPPPPNMSPSSLDSSFGKWNYTTSQRKSRNDAGLGSCRHTPVASTQIPSHRLVWAALSGLWFSVCTSLVDLEILALWSKMWTKQMTNIWNLAYSRVDASALGIRLLGTLYIYLSFFPLTHEELGKFLPLNHFKYCAKIYNLKSK